MNSTESHRVVEVIGQRVAAFRKRQRLSLNQLAARAGVSKGSLAGLEKGAGNPGIALLCQTATALRVSVTDLLEISAMCKAEEFALEAGKVVWRGSGGGTARLVFGTRGPLMFELWEWELFPGERYEAKAHSPGTKEILYPLSGRVGAVVDGEALEARRGYGLSLQTDAPHSYFCAGVKPVRFRMIVVESPEGGTSKTSAHFASPPTKENNGRKRRKGEPRR
jgi:transcriptional regulator with XRE-family HTH domain